MNTSTVLNNRSTFESLPEILTPKEISHYLGICYTKALDVIKYGGIRYIKINNTYRVRKADLHDCLTESNKKIISTND